ncbi:MAG: glutaconate CoA-transferase subunit A [Desulforhopalus sp.]|jgi:glutaconate CoA-transferase subunit A
MQETAQQEACTQEVTDEQGMHDKRTSLTEAVKRYLKDGINIGIGGFDNNRIPVASIHEIIRQGAHDLTLTVQDNSICCELLAGAMILNPAHLTINKVELGLLGYKVNGTAPLLQHLANNKKIQLVDYTKYGMSASYNGEVLDVPSLPTINYDCSDIAPACGPDLALIHVQTSDTFGNSQIIGDHCRCHEMAQVSVNTLVTVEQIIQNCRIPKDPNVTQIPSHVVDAVVDQPFGATPGACHGHYWFDISEIQEFTDICEDFCKTGNKDKLKAYYNKHIFELKNFDDLLEQKPYPILQRLCQQDGNHLVT